MNGKRMPGGLLPLLMAGLLLAPASLAFAAPDAGGLAAGSGAVLSPAAAYEDLLTAQRADRAGDVEEAIAKYRLAVRLDPCLLDAWIGLIRKGFPSNLHLMLEGASGGARAVGESWLLQRRLLAFLFPAVWSAAFLAAALFLLGIGLRHLPRRRHVLLEAFRPHLGRWSAGTVATLLCLVPLGVQWGLGAAAASYAGAAGRTLNRRERRIGILAFAWLCLAPVVWHGVAPRIAPVGADSLAVLIERAQRETPTPALEGLIAIAADREPGTPAVAFVQGISHRRASRFAEAETSFRSALSAGPPIAPHAMVNLGNLQLWAGDTPGAARRYEQVLDDENARVEARYNLAVALSRLRRFEEADEQLEVASRLDLGRVRSAVRLGSPEATTAVLDGLLAPSELWRLDASTTIPPIPPLVGRLLPGGRLAAGPLALVGGLLAGLLLGRLFDRRLRVHQCQHCAAPVCRRCVVRTGRHAYCASCAARLGNLPRAAYGRTLLAELLGGETDRGARLRERLVPLIPGVGPILRGRPLGGLLSGGAFLLGLLAATRTAWSFPPSPGTVEFEQILRLAGLIGALAAWGISFELARRARTRRGVRGYFEKDVFRLAA